MEWWWLLLIVPSAIAVGAVIGVCWFLNQIWKGINGG